MMWLRLFRESLAFAWNAIVMNKLRTFLSLLGVMVGIFVISAVFAVVDSMEENLMSSFEMLDDDVFFIQKWPWNFGEDYPLSKIGYEKCLVDSGIITAVFASFYGAILTCHQYTTPILSGYRYCSKTNFLRIFIYLILSGIAIGIAILVAGTELWLVFIVKN